MTCKCVNSDGNPAEKCYGTCSLKDKIQEQREQNRDELNDFAELILSQVNKMIDTKIKDIQISFQQSQIELYKKAFLEGIQEGMKLMDKYDD